MLIHLVGAKATVCYFHNPDYSMLGSMDSGIVHPIDSYDLIAMNEDYPVMAFFDHTNLNLSSNGGFLKFENVSNIAFEHFLGFVNLVNFPEFTYQPVLNYSSVEEHFFNDSFSPIISDPFYLVRSKNLDFEHGYFPYKTADNMPNEKVLTEFLQGYKNA